MLCFFNVLFHENQIYSTDDEKECQYMVPMEVLPLKQNVGNNGKHTQTDTFLNYLELHQIKGTAIAVESHSVGWYLTAIFQESYSP